jgi:hypothetical protein
MISERVAKTSLFRQKEELGISYVWETGEYAVFEKIESGDPIIGEYLIYERFSDGSIKVTDSNGNLMDATERIMNLFRLGI